MCKCLPKLLTYFKYRFLGHLQLKAATLICRAPNFKYSLLGPLQLKSAAFICDTPTVSHQFLIIGDFHTDADNFHTKNSIHFFFKPYSACSSLYHVGHTVVHGSGDWSWYKIVAWS